MADELSSALRRIAGRHKIAYASPRAMAESGADLPVLLAAVQAALEIHALTAAVRYCDPCQRHKFDIAGRRGCPDCQFISYAGCAGCRNEQDVPSRPEECATRQAIRRELLGEEKNDAG